MDTKVKTDTSQLRVNGERLWNSLMELAQIGATAKGGVCRLALTDLDRQGRDLVTRWAKEAGMTVTIDKIGNGFMRRPGRNNSLPPIMTGSHIDTQPTGGKFDGNYGVLAGIEVVRTLNDHGIETEAPIEVAFWTNEEGSRFVPVMMGSGVFAKAFTLEHAYAATDTEGKTVKGELERIGYIGEQEPGDHPIGAYFETHIEQGPVLEDNDKTIGVVSGVLGIRWFDCTVTGMEAHAGPTPMALRKDAMLAATRIMQDVVAAAHRHPPHGRGTVGMVQVFPNSRNVIPGHARLMGETRGATPALNDYMFNQVQQIVEGAALMQGATYLIRKQGEAIGIENSPALIEELVPLAQGIALETIHSRRFGASEDAGFLIERVQQSGGQAAYLILGANLAAPHHHPEFDFDESVLAPGVALLEAWLLRRLGR